MWETGWPLWWFLCSYSYWKTKLRALPNELNPRYLIPRNGYWNIFMCREHKFQDSWENTPLNYFYYSIVTFSADEGWKRTKGSNGCFSHCLWHTDCLTAVALAISCIEKPHLPELVCVSSHLCALWIFCSLCSGTSASSGISEQERSLILPPRDTF